MFLRSRQPTRIPLAQVAMGAAQLAFFQLSGAVLLGGTTKTFRGPRPAPVAEAVTLSPLVFGTLRLHETEDPFALLTEAWNLGITSFDCAAVYGGGRCEEILGAWLRDGATPAAARAGAVVVTKGGCGAPDTSWAPRLAYDDLRAELDASLAKLGRVDVYLLHRDDPGRPVAEIVRSMNKLLASERGPKAWGVSNWATPRIAEARAFADARGLAGPTCSSVQDSLAAPRHAPWPGTEYMTDADRAWYESHADVPVLSWEVLAKGFLAGRWDRADAFAGPPPVDAFSPGMDMDRWREDRLTSAYLTDANFDRRDRAAALGAARGLGPEHVAVAWCARQRYPSHVCVATTTVAHLRSNVKALALDLDDDDLAWLARG